jgi:hypothetical protein
MDRPLRADEDRAARPGPPCAATPPGRGPASAGARWCETRPGRRYGSGTSRQRGRHPAGQRRSAGGVGTRPTRGVGTRPGRRRSTCGRPPGIDVRPAGGGRHAAGHRGSTCDRPAKVDTRPATEGRRVAWAVEAGASSTATGRRRMTVRSVGRPQGGRSSAAGRPQEGVRPFRRPRHLPRILAAARPSSRVPPTALPASTPSRLGDHSSSIVISYFYQWPESSRQDEPAGGGIMITSAGPPRDQWEVGHDA